MSLKRIYLDYAATTPVHPRVIEAMQPYYAEKYGNPSSIHYFGQEARAVVERARESVAHLIGAKADEIVFTSGGTEADNFSLVGVAFANRRKGNHLIISMVEHHAVTACCDFLKEQGFEITAVPVDRSGVVDPAEVQQALTDRTILVSIMHANNEIGTIEPIEKIGVVVRGQGIIFHVDAVQTAGHLPVKVDELGVDLLSLSAHKFYGPKGVGALYIRKGTNIVPFLRGGGQERGRRASTENVPGIVGLGVAAEIANREMREEKDKLVPLREKLSKGILEKIPDSLLNGHPTNRLPNNVNVSIKYIEGESMLLNLDMHGVAASTGSACTSGSLEPSHVLLAIGLSPELAHGSLRFSLGRFTSAADIEYVLEILPDVVKKLRAMSPLVRGGK